MMQSTIDAVVQRFVVPNTTKLMWDAVNASAETVKAQCSSGYHISWMSLPTHPSIKRVANYCAGAIEKTLNISIPAKEFVKFIIIGIQEAGKEDVLADEFEKLDAAERDKAISLAQYTLGLTDEQLPFADKWAVIGQILSTRFLLDHPYYYVTNSRNEIVGDKSLIIQLMQVALELLKTANEYKPPVDEYLGLVQYAHQNYILKFFETGTGILP